MKTLAQLKKDLDKQFSLYTRLSDANDEGYSTCVTCGKVAQWKEMDAGHYITRNHLSTRWEELNVWSQCRGCNRFGGGKPDEYAIFLIKQFGDDILTQLHQQKHTITKMSRADYEEKITYYKERVAELQTTTNMVL